MTHILVTGAKGFIGRHVVTRLKCCENTQVFEFDLENSEADLRKWAAEADVILHLAGVNRPQNVEDFETGNAGLTSKLCNILREAQRAPHIILTSSIQAELENPYGVSKRHAEEILRKFGDDAGARISIFRLKNVFGAGCRPNYNSVTATFCHNIAHDLPIQISDPNHRLELVHVEDVVSALIAEMQASKSWNPDSNRADAIPSYSLTLADLAGRIQFYHDMQRSLHTPDFSIRFNQQLYATYLTYIEPTHWEYGLDIKSDSRGSLAEFIKSPWFGQIFVSRTRPGITRGNHYHHIKAEKFLVLEGEGLICFRKLDSTEVLKYRICGKDYRVVEIPPLHTHSITNVGSGEMITLFWASEIFKPDQPDTYYLPVETNPGGTQ